MSISLDIRWRYAGKAPAEFKPEFFALLQEVESSGSLRSAAKTLNVSYRHAWGLIREWSKRLGEPVAEMHRGRGARLTRLGTKLLWDQRRLSARLAPELESIASELNSSMAALVESEPLHRIRACASHGLALGVLRDLLNAQGKAYLDLQFRGSLDSLQSFRSGKCDLAGFHFPFGEVGTGLAARFRPLLQADHHLLMKVVEREQGIIVATGNPKHIKSVANLANPGVRIINREPAAGTRLIFDALLQQAGIDGAAVKGYNDQEFTHTAVAAMVASGAVDAGFGIRAAAALLNLGFVPLVRERYLFALRREDLRSRPMVELRAMLRSAAFAAGVKPLAGYSVPDSGSILTVEELFP